jgi:hypothetical protein
MGSRVPRPPDGGRVRFSRGAHGRTQAGSRRALPAASSSHHFPGGFADPTYLEWERNYKWEAHRAWRGAPAPGILARDPARAVADAIRIEAGRTSCFSFEKMALRDAVRTPAGSRDFGRALENLLSGAGPLAGRFDAFCDVLGRLPKRGTRVRTWPVATVFGFLAQPRRHLYLKPMVTKRAAEAYGYSFEYAPSPTFATYRSLLDFGRTVRRDLTDLAPRDQIDIQSFLWVLGSDEYPD